MNIFYLSPDAKTCAEMHLDKHVVKMIIEYSQLMSTAHRVLDGEEYYDKSITGRKVQRWRLSDERETLLMKPTMMKHPSAIWVRANDENYRWLFAMWTYLCQEYTFRYGKQHACSRLLTSLDKLPFNITTGAFFPPTPAMPDDCKVPGDSLASYHKYYIEKKVSFAKWTKREVPLWFQNGINKNNANLQLL